jgi:hypothetical protein
MVERVRSQKALLCTDEHYHELAVAMNKSPDTVFVSMTALDDVAACHHRATGDPMALDRMMAQTFPSLRLQGRKFYAVDRMELFYFHVAHGKVCPHG